MRRTTCLIFAFAMIILAACSDTALDNETRGSVSDTDTSVSPVAEEQPEWAVPSRKDTPKPLSGVASNRNLHQSGFCVHDGNCADDEACVVISPGVNRCIQGETRQNIGAQVNAPEGLLDGRSRFQ